MPATKAKKKTATKTVKKPVKKPPAKRASATNAAKARKASAKPKPAKPAKPARQAFPPLDLSAFPPDTATVSEKWLCLACVTDIFLHQLNLTRTAALREIRAYTPSVAELDSPAPGRPWFAKDPIRKDCPFCGSKASRHARLMTYRIEGGKPTDAARRDLIKCLPKTGDKFAVIEEKVTRQHAFFEWLEKISGSLDLDDPTWLRDVSRHYLERIEPKSDWAAAFDGLRMIRRSRRVEAGWELDQQRLFLAPMLFDELLLVQYLVSRSHRAGGLTLEGRYTLSELLIRLRNSGYLRTTGVSAQDSGEVLEQLVVHLSGGGSSAKFYHIVDRRDFLEKSKLL